MFKMRRVLITFLLNTHGNEKLDIIEPIIIVIKKKSFPESLKVFPFKISSVIQPIVRSYFFNLKLAQS